MGENAALEIHHNNQEIAQIVAKVTAAGDHAWWEVLLGWPAGRIQPAGCFGPWGWLGNSIGPARNAFGSQNGTRGGGHMSALLTLFLAWMASCSTLQAKMGYGGPHAASPAPHFGRLQEASIRFPCLLPS
ncbi:hypothetical protein L345_00924, partial [Ophiophagus hannah]